MDKRLQTILVLILALGLQFGVATIRPDLSTVTGALSTIILSLMHSVMGEKKPESKEDE